MVEGSWFTNCSSGIVIRGVYARKNNIAKTSVAAILNDYPLRDGSYDPYEKFITSRKL